MAHVKNVDYDGRTTVIEVGEPVYRHLMIGTVPVRGFETLIVAIQGVPEITGSNSGWRVFVNGVLVDVYFFTAKTVDDKESFPGFVGADDMVDYQIEFTLGHRHFCIGNRSNEEAVERRPIRRIDPESVLLTFRNGCTTVNL